MAIPFRQKSIRLLCMTVFLVIASSMHPLQADLIPPGNKGVTHNLVFVDSPLLQSHRLIAMPVRGFGGFEEMRAGHGFQFSSKYGTRLYVVPRDYVPPSRIRLGDSLSFPSCDVPVRAKTYVPLLSPVQSLRSTCKLVEVTDTGIRVELIEHVELGSNGRPVTKLQSVFPFLGISAAGLLGCLIIWRRTRAKTLNAQLRDAEVQS